MDDEEIFERWVEAHEHGDTEALADCMADDFVFEQEGLSKQLDKQEYLALVEQLHNAFPDLGLEARSTSIEESDGTIRWQQGLSATHEQDLDLTELGLPFFFSTGNKLDLDADEVRTQLDDGRITSQVVDDASGSLGGLLDQLEDGLESIRQEARERDSEPPGY